MVIKKTSPTWSDVKTRLTEFDRWLWPDVYVRCRIRSVSHSVVSPLKIISAA